MINHCFSVWQPASSSDLLPLPTSDLLPGDEEALFSAGNALITAYVLRFSDIDPLAGENDLFQLPMFNEHEADLTEDMHYMEPADSEKAICSE